MNTGIKLCLAAIGVSIVIVIASAVLSTNEYMLRLPVYENLRCAICHTTPSPTDGSSLNKFGEDFRDNGFMWDYTLANKDSDGDSFSNGEELGDRDGDGTADVDRVRSNPGDVSDRPSSVDEKTWGLIKNLFED